MKTEIESAVIVKNDYGSVAMLRFNDRSRDRSISANSKPTLYTLIEKYVQDVTSDGN